MPTHPLRSRRALSIIAVLAGLTAAIAAILLFHPRDRTATPPKVAANDVSNRATACLVTDTTTASKNDDVAKLWTAIQTVGTQSGKNVEQLIKPATNGDQATPYLASLISQRCDLIITVGPAFGQAIPTLAKSDPTARFTAINSSLTGAPPGVTLLPAERAITDVQQQVQTLQHATAPHS